MQSRLGGSGMHDETAKSAVLPMNTWIALVDDDLSVRRSLPRLLSSAGYKTRAFATAHELIESGIASEVSCLVLDIHLERSNGFELLERLRSGGVTTPAIFITAYEDDSAAERARVAGAVAFLRKPFDGTALLDAISRAVTNPAGSSASRRT
jgi:FixJ family two-component response regulator